MCRAVKRPAPPGPAADRTCTRASCVSACFLSLREYPDNHGPGACPSMRYKVTSHSDLGVCPSLCQTA
eukprot:scaffold18313_cov12-Tisochrysis_lutea.AAC.1